MHLKSLSLINFKNYAQAEFELNEGINCFVGKNGAGKTNVLDAVHYLSMCKSYLNPVDKQNIRFNEQFFVVQGTWQEEDKETEMLYRIVVNPKALYKYKKLKAARTIEHKLPKPQNN
jgi:DNA replication and repair protein RecF